MKLWRVLLLVVGLGLAMIGLTSCTEMSQNYQDGKENFQNQHYDQAFEELLPAAEKGNASAQYAIGYMYYYGRGVVRNQKLAEYWMNKAAAQGNENALQALKQIQGDN